ncbi:MAG: wax ester/triacylglycerol synthase family O-acyltransferase [Pseudonocardiaceae bacterium]
MAAERLRLSGLDTAFLCLERDITPMQLGALVIFQPSRPMSAEQVASLLAERVRRLPRLGRRVQRAWFPPGSATWADDPGFHPADHIHAHHLSGADSYGQATELTSKLMARPLRRNRPLWELHVMSGLRWRDEPERFGVLVKLHHAFGDGMAALEIGVGLLDEWGPQGPARGVPTSSGAHPVTSLMATASSWSTIGHILTAPCRLVSGVRRAAGEAIGQATDLIGMAASVLGGARLPSPGSPLVITSSGRRELGFARLDLQDVRRIRAHFGGATVNDVLLAVVAGALRDWLGTRGHPVDGLRLRALIPVSCRARSGGRIGGNQMSGYLCELPVGEPDAGERLRIVQQAMRHSKAVGPTRGPGAIPLLAERLPPALHRFAAPVVGQVAALLFDLMVTSVPVPGISLRLGGAELVEVFPVAPLAPGHALVVGLSCYRGTAYIGLHVDRDALPGVDGLVKAIPASASALDQECA